MVGSWRVSFAFDIFSASSAPALPFARAKKGASDSWSQNATATLKILRGGDVKDHWQKGPVRCSSLSAPIHVKYFILLNIIRVAPQW